MRDDVFQQVVDAARAHGVTEIEAIISSENEALTRFANNVIHQNVAERTTHLSVRPVIGNRTARASTNRLDRDAIRNVVAEAIAITRLTEPDPELQPLFALDIEPRPSGSGVFVRHFPRTAQATPQHRAQAVAESIAAVQSADQTAAGIYSTADTTLSF